MFLNFPPSYHQKIIKPFKDLCVVINDKCCQMVSTNHKKYMNIKETVHGFEVICAAYSSSSTAQH